MDLDTCVYTCHINRPASAPLADSLFPNQLIIFITAVSTLLLSASVVAPSLGLLLRMKSPMKTPVVNNYGCIFCLLSSKFLNMGSYSPMLAFFPLSLANKKPLSITLRNLSLRIGCLWWHRVLLSDQTKSGIPTRKWISRILYR